MNALLVFGVLFNRIKLVKVLIKYSNEPLLQVLFAESLYHSLYQNISNVAISGMLKAIAGDLSQVAVDLFDTGVATSPERGHAILVRKFVDFNNKTPLDLAYDTNNK